MKFPALLLTLSFLAPLARAAEDPACIEAYKEETRRIGLKAKRDAKANPPGKDLEAQQRFMAPVHAALKAAAEKAEQCEKNSRAARPGPTAEANRRAKACVDRSQAQATELQRRYAGRTDLSRAEQAARREAENRMVEDRMACLREAR